MNEPTLTRHFQMYVKAATQPEGMARTIYSTIFPPTNTAIPHPIEYDFQQTNEIYWDDELPHYTEIFGEFVFQDVVLEVRYPAETKHVHLFQLHGGGIECKPISIGSNEFSITAPEAVAIRLLSALVTEVLMCQRAPIRLKYLLADEDPDLVYSRLYQVFWGKSETEAIEMMENYCTRMPEYAEDFIKYIGIHLKVKNPVLAIDYLFRAMKLGVSVRGERVKAEYLHEILESYFNQPDFEAAVLWANQCCADPALGQFSKAEICIKLFDYIRYNRQSDAHYPQLLQLWANRCALEFKNNRLQRTLAEMGK